MGRIDRFSPKQLRVLTWWLEEGYSGILCDGAIRSGKTFCLTLSFVLWAMASFAGEDFAICARTIRGLRRNLLFPLLPYLRELGMEVREQPSQNLVTIRQGEPAEPVSSLRRQGRGLRRPDPRRHPGGGAAG